MSLSDEPQAVPTAESTEGFAGPRISRIRAAVTVAAALAVAGVVVGAIWAWLAPPIHGAVALTRSGERAHVYLGSEADHFFTVAFLLLGLLMVVAVVSAVAVWQWRAHRGPILACALAVGCVASAAAASAVGAVLAHWRYGSIDIAGAPVTPEHRVHYVTEAPPVFFGHSPWQIAATLASPQVEVYGSRPASSVRSRPLAMAAVNSSSHDP